MERIHAVSDELTLAAAQLALARDLGSGERPDQAPAPDWVATVTLLLDAGASTDGITLSPDDEKPPSTEVARLLRERGVVDRDSA